MAVQRMLGRREAGAAGGGRGCGGLVVPATCFLAVKKGRYSIQVQQDSQLSGISPDAVLSHFYGLALFSEH